MGYIFRVQLDGPGAHSYGKREGGVLISEGGGGYMEQFLSRYQYNASARKASRLRTTFARNRVTTVFAN